MEISVQLTAACSSLRQTTPGIEQSHPSTLSLPLQGWCGKIGPGELKRHGPASRNLRQSDLRAMEYEEIGEKIEVISYFQGGDIHPLRFRWQERVYHVRKVHGRWSSLLGSFRIHHFSVGVEGPDVYELTYSTETQEWEVSRICLV